MVTDSNSCWKSTNMEKMLSIDKGNLGYILSMFSFTYKYVEPKESKTTSLLWIHHCLFKKIKPVWSDGNPFNIDTNTIVPLLQTYIAQLLLLLYIMVTRACDQSSERVPHVWTKKVTTQSLFYSNWQKWCWNTNFKIKMS